MGTKAIKKTVALRPDVWEYIAREAKDNVSGFINRVMREHRKATLREQLKEGYRAMAADTALSEDIRLWDTTLGDGLTDDDDTSK